jgi:beta-phosphoglucomutase-like phosphatase (HAD superfamily)
MAPPYSCLVIDHDDTSVASTRAIHYPAHVEALRRLRPGREPIAFEGWLRKNFDPGLMAYLVGELGFTPEELAENHAVWRGFTGARAPEFFPGFLALLAEFRSRGGLVVVASHSEPAMIERDYRAAAAGGAGAFLPDAVYGWSAEPEFRKPSPYPVLDAMARFGLEPGQVLVLDDLKPGFDMSAAAGVDCAGAGWGYDIPEIRDAMRDSCRWYFETVGDFARFLLGA